ncbi:hypothetical protein MCAP1_000964 [Malassezia caprae]|uniref:Uncharacterized protein n=1 Tax=Malassezia caprae TaxID=1381934 RepID=A0AAF0E758_9BASI|nr:hypothetical protein MCAP1_000964 [Malassezia caprae]
MEQRAQRARHALLSKDAMAPSTSASTWSGMSWPSRGVSPPPPPSFDADARNGGVSAAPAPRADEAAPQGGAQRAKRGAESNEPLAKRLREGLDGDAAYGARSFESIRELHPEFHDAPQAPIVLDAALPLMLNASSSVALREPRASRARRTKPDLEKARALFVAAHAGQTYEQMVLEHAYSSDRLFWLKEAYGLTWRTGRWSDDEEERATEALRQFCDHYKLTQAGLDELIWHRKPEQKHMHEELWKHISLSVGTRPNYAVRMHIKSMRKDVVRGGHWTPADVEALAAAVSELGHQWEKIGARLGRSGNVCKHYWREQVQSRTGPAPQGAFRAEEEAALRQAVLACCEEVGCAPDGPNLPWTLIHERLGPSPRRISVLSRKWRGMLSAERRISEEQNTRWYAPHDDHILLQRIRAQCRHSAADIDFDKLATPEWQWPMYVIKKHWVVMLRKRAPNFQGTLDELLDYLSARVPSPEEYKMLASGRRSAGAARGAIEYRS